MKDLFTFIDNWNSYRPFLYEALELTKNGKVFEFGVGDGSTLLLKEYCKKNNREYKGFDYDKDWAKKYNAEIISDWNLIPIEELSVLFIDHSPGERRVDDIIRWANDAKIIVAHDTEPAADHGYKMSKAWIYFKYVKHYETNGAWATMASNFFPLS
jgi:hypothetical protein